MSLVRLYLPLQRVRAAVVLAAGLAAGLTCNAMATAEFSVGGEVERATTFNLTTLQALPSRTQTVSFGSGSGPQTHTYTGPTLWGVLGAAGIAVDPSRKNDVLNRYVVATGSDGYRAVFALGELDPGFGNRPDLVAHTQLIDGKPAALGEDGFARVTAPGDVRGGRYVSNLASLEVHASASKAGGGTGGGSSTRFSVSGDVKQTMSFDLAGLKLLPALTRTVGTTTYTGVSFWDLLNTTVGLSLDPSVRNDVLGKYVVATGNDGYRAVFSLGELSPDFGNQLDFIAYEAEGQPLTGDGFARVVVPNDVRAGRYVSNLVSLEVFSAAVTPPVPEPGSYALMLAGLSAIALGRRVSTRMRRAPA